MIHWLSTLEFFFSLFFYSPVYPSIFFKYGLFSIFF